jgi:hypothetical protein
VTAPTPTKPRIIAEAATPAMIGLIRIDAGLTVPALMIVFESRIWRRNLGCRLQSPCQRKSFQSTQRVIRKSRKPAKPDMSPVDDGLRGPVKDPAEGKGILLSSCGDSAMKRAPNFSPSRA